MLKFFSTTFIAVLLLYCTSPLAYAMEKEKDKDYSTKVKYRANDDDKNGLYSRAESYFFGNEKNIPEAIKLFNQLLEMGPLMPRKVTTFVKNLEATFLDNPKEYAPVYFELAEIYLRGETGFGISKKQAIKWYKHAIINDHVGAQKGLILCLEDALEMPIFADECFELSGMYLSGTGGFEKNFPEARKWFVRAIRKGHVGAQKAWVSYLEDHMDMVTLSHEYFELAEMYLSGTFFEKNVSEARKWYTCAANQGHIGAQRILAALNNSLD